MSNLQATQLSTVMNIMNGLQKDLGAGWQDVLSTTALVLKSNIAPLYDNVSRIFESRKSKKDHIFSN